MAIALTSPQNRISGQRIFGIRLSALAESAAFLGVLTFYDYITGGTHFSAYAVHPFLIVVLLITTQYGLAEALACAAMASIFLIAGHFVPDQALNETFYDYIARLSHLPLMWLLIAATAGLIRSREIKKSETLTADLQEARKREEVIARQYTELRKAKDALEERVAQESNGFISAFQAAAAMQSLDEKEIVKGLSAVIATAVAPTSFSFFLLKHHTLHRLYAEGWPEQGFTPRFFKNTPLFQQIVNNRASLCALNPDDKEILQADGIIAVPIFDPRDGEVYGMLKMESIPLTGLTFRTMERCKLLAQWAGMAIANARTARLRGKRDGFLKPRLKELIRDEHLVAEPGHAAPAY